MSVLKYSCGCKFIIEDGKEEEIFCKNPITDIPKGKIKLDIYNVPLDCSATWKLFADGYNVGLFQLEKSLGQQWMKKVKPQNIEELACLISILRPGILKAVSGDPPKSMAERYVDRKHGRELVDDLGIPDLGNITSDSMGVLIYQEHAIHIARDLAGFSESEADILRRAIGHKEADTMAKLEDGFIKGCLRIGKVSKEQGIEIFGWIRESQKYSFNRSHATEYAKNSYWSAYCKTHFPLQFFCSYLRHAEAKQDRYQEVGDIVNETKLMDILVNLPDIRDLKENFYIKNNNIYFGLTNVKQIGKSSFQKLISQIKKAEEDLNKDLKDWEWLDYLFYIGEKVPQPTSIALIAVGALDYFGESRQEMVYTLGFWSNILTGKEREWIKTQQIRWPTILHAVKACAHPKKDGGGCNNYKRVKILQGVAESIENPPHSLKDTLDYIAWSEAEFLGISISCSRVEDKKGSIQANCTCRDIFDGKGGYLVLAAKVDRVNEIKTKNNKQMAFLTLSDNTCALNDVVVFPNVFSKFKNLFQKESVVLIRGTRSKKGNFVCNQVSQI